MYMTTCGKYTYEKFKKKLIVGCHNMSVLPGIVSNEWKLANIVPVHKRGSIKE
jgi:hypothetical protein